MYKYNYQYRDMLEKTKLLNYFLNIYTIYVYEIKIDKNSLFSSINYNIKLLRNNIKYKYVIRKPDR
ncbi:hypothetical protein GCM10022297_07740 [Lactobacillus hamsteri]